MFFNYLKILTKWSLGIFFICLGGIFLLPPINSLINSNLSRFKVVEKTNDWGRFFIAFVISVFLINIFAPSRQIKTNNTQNSAVGTAPTENISYLNNKNSNKLAKDLKLSKEQSAKIYRILANCGVNDIDYIEKMDGTDLTGYFVHISNANNPVRLGLTANKDIDMVIYDAWVLYEDGVQKANLNDYAISSEDMLTLRVASMQNVRKYLTKPETAKFDDDWKATKLDNAFNLSSTVKYKNDLNQELKSSFTIQFEKEKGSLKMILLNIDNQIVFKEETPQKTLSKKDKKEVKEIEKLMGI